MRIRRNISRTTETQTISDRLSFRMFATVISEIFARTLFSRNLAYAKFRENKTLTKWQITLSFIDMGKSCLSREYFTSLICLLMLFAKIKFLRKFPNLQFIGSNCISISLGPSPEVIKLFLLYSIRVCTVNQDKIELKGKKYNTFI